MTVEHRYRGKVRDVYAMDDGELLLVASDRLSVYDVVLPTEVPDKGALLTAMSAWWFDHLADLVPNHMLSVDAVPEALAGRAMRCTALEMMPVECVVRGYLAGGGFEAYADTGSVSDVPLPAGLAEGSRLPSPVFTPTSKSAYGGHDEPITAEDLADLVGAATAGSLQRLALELYERAAGHFSRRSMILADTKFEFGRDGRGRIVLGDEAVTCDSSRIWSARAWLPGRPGGQRPFDKQLVRDWARRTGWDRRAPGPEVPGGVVEQVRRRYTDVYETVTGRRWHAEDEAQPPEDVPLLNPGP